MATTAEPADEREELCSLAPSWWTFLLRGVLALVFAVLAWFLPVEAVLALTLLFGAFALVNGILELISGVRRGRRGERWVSLVLGGLLGVAVGVAVVLVPLIATLAMAAFLWASVIVWAIGAGFAEISAAIRLRREITGEWLMALSGLLALLLGALVIWFLFTTPELSVFALGWVLAAFALFYGLLLIMLGIRLRKLCSPRSDGTTPESR